MQIQNGQDLIKHYYHLINKPLGEPTKAEEQAANDWLVRYGPDLAVDLIERCVKKGECDTTNGMEKLRLSVHRNAIAARIDREVAARMQADDHEEALREAKLAVQHQKEAFIADCLERGTITQSMIEQTIHECKVEENYTAQDSLSDRLMAHYFRGRADAILAEKFGFKPEPEVRPEAPPSFDHTKPDQMVLPLGASTPSGSGSRATIIEEDLSDAQIANISGNGKCILARVESLHIDSRNPNKSYLMFSSKQLPTSNQPFRLSIGNKEVVYDGTKPFQGNHLDSRFARHNPIGTPLILSGLFATKGVGYRAACAFPLSADKSYKPGLMSLTECSSLKCTATVAAIWDRKATPATKAELLITKFRTSSDGLKTSDPWRGFLFRATGPTGTLRYSKPFIWKTVKDQPYTYVDMLAHLVSFKKEVSNTRMSDIEILSCECIKLAPYVRFSADLVNAVDGNGHPIALEGVVAINRHPHFGVSVVSSYLPHLRDPSQTTTVQIGTGQETQSNAHAQPRMEQRP